MVQFSTVHIINILLASYVSIAIGGNTQSHPAPPLQPKPVFSDAFRERLDNLPNAREPLRYEERNLIGIGGFSRVYKSAKSQQFGKELAVKVFHSDDSDPTAQDFVFESEATAALDITPHPNILPWYQMRPFSKPCWIASMYCNRGQIDEYMMAVNPDSMEFLRLLMEVKLRFNNYYYNLLIVSGLEHLHGERMTHRDIKPQNILIHQPGYPEDSSESVEVRLADFGLVKACPHTIVQMSRIAGTTGYIAPEIALAQLVGGSVSYYKADVWSLGRTLRTLLGVHIKGPQGSDTRIVECIDRISLRMIAEDPESRPSPTAILEELLSLQSV